MNNIFKILAQKLAALSPSCKEATRLQSTSLDRGLTLSEKFGLRVHLGLCKWCSRYGGQIKFLRSAAQDHQHSAPHGLSPEARERIKQRLRSEQD